MSGDVCGYPNRYHINSGSAAERGSVPGYFDTIFGSIQIMQQAIVEQELRACPPDLYIKPQLSDFRTLRYHKVDEIYRQADAAKQELKRRLAERLAI